MTRRLVLGSLDGQVESAVKKVASLHEKNGFSLAILVGDVFTPSTDEATITSLLEGCIEFPISTYFTVSTHPLPPRVAAKVEADEEICPNLHFLGKRGIIQTAEGVRIVALGGLLDPNLVGGQSKEQHLPFHTADDVKALRGANQADVLVTSMWPAGVWNDSKVPLEHSQRASIKSTEDISQLCAALKPRYHFTASPDVFFYEREPFMQPTANESDQPAVTRFISMAPYGNDAKAKAMYAFTLNKSDTSIPAASTRSPFISRINKRPKTSHYYGEDDYTNHEDRHIGRHHKRRRRSPPPGPDRCYFCLSNPNLSTHMLCSLGDDAYITTAKGPITTSKTFAELGLNYPGHFIIIPLPHAPTIASLGSVAEPDSEASRTYKEMERFRDAIQATVSSKSGHKLGAITWEISRDRNVHLIWQMIAVPADMVQKGIAEAAFRVEAENQQYPPFDVKDLEPEEMRDYGDFFRVWLWADNGEDKIKSTSLVMPLTPDMRFDLQFGRQVVAKLLGLESTRMVWQDCTQSKEEETRDVEAFREAFKEWDFTMQE